MKKLVVLTITVIAVMLVWLGVTLSRPPFDCRKVAKLIGSNDANTPIERWLDQHASEWDGVKNRSMPRHLFPYGLYALPVPFDPLKFGLRADAEAQAVVDQDYKLMAVELVDSRAQKVVINRYMNLWYRWKPEMLATINSRSGVVCSGRD